MRGIVVAKIFVQNILTTGVFYKIVKQLCKAIHYFNRESIYSPWKINSKIHYHYKKQKTLNPIYWINKENVSRYLMQVLIIIKIKRFGQFEDQIMQIQK